MIIGYYFDSTISTVSKTVLMILTNEAFFSSQEINFSFIFISTIYVHLIICVFIVTLI